MPDLAVALLAEQEVDLSQHDLAVDPFGRRERRGGKGDDSRMILREGLRAPSTSAKYFADELPGIAAERTRGEAFSASLVANLRRDGGRPPPKRSDASAPFSSRHSSSPRRAPRRR